MSDSCDPMDYSLLVSPAHGISQARILEWVAISFSRGPSRSRDQTHVSYIAGGLLHWKQILYCWASREPHPSIYLSSNPSNGLMGHSCSSPFFFRWGSWDSKKWNDFLKGLDPGFTLRSVWFSRSSSLHDIMYSLLPTPQSFRAFKGTGTNRWWPLLA